MLVCIGVAVALTSGAALPWLAEVRGALLGWAAVSLALAVPSLVAGLLLRELDSGLGVPSSRRAPGRLRRALRYLATHQAPAGGPLWPDPAPGCPADPRLEQQHR
jgi:predicted MFS family arabinose efflux permease